MGLRAFGRVLHSQIFKQTSTFSYVSVINTKKWARTSARGLSPTQRRMEMSQEEDFERTSDLLLKINDVVGKMDPALRVQTFDLLVARYLGKPVAQAKTATASTDKEKFSEKTAPDTSELGKFIVSLDTKKPADALNVLIAWLYSQRGSQPFTVNELKELADSCGLTIPSRPDMTLRQSKNDGKTLFSKSGSGWKLTVSGELHLKENYKVSKGVASVVE